jgi:hypothetical protein
MFKLRPIYLLLFLPILIILAPLLAQNRPVHAQIGSGGIAIEQVASDQGGLKFTLLTEPFSLKDGAVQLAGLTQYIQAPGAPALPYYATFIALPPAATATVNVQELDVSLRMVAGIAPAPQPAAPIAPLKNDAPAPYNVAPAGADDSYGPPPLIYKPDPAIYERNAFYPAALFSVSEPMYYRDLRLVELRLYPLRYNPVSSNLFHARQLSVSITFHGAQWDNLRPPPVRYNAYQGALADLVLNYEQAKGWRSLPSHLLNAPTTNLPIGVDTYKIEVGQDGIYEISGADLAAQGMAIGDVDPDTIEMMYRGEPVAYQFTGDNDAVFEAGEKVRFYGWAFDGPRTEKQFVSHNVFWLWAGGAPTPMMSRANQTGTYPIATSYLATITAEPENAFFSTWTNQWPSFPNEPDAWYWDYITNSTGSPVTLNYEVELFDPVTSGPEATYTVEMMSKANLDHVVEAYINNNPTPGAATWFGRRSVNITNTVPATDLVNGLNDFSIVVATAGIEQIYLNRISVEYQRLLMAKNDQLLFSDEVGGGRELHVAGFSQGDVAGVLVWDISDPRRPIQINLSAGDISGAGSFTYKIGGNHAADTRFIATTSDNILSGTATISQYTPVSLDPADGKAEWLAISHKNFIGQANRLAAHRASLNFGHMATYVADIEHVINQYGYGLPLPGAIRDYLAHALSHWSLAPEYVVLIGDATISPRGLDCVEGCFAWDKDAPSFVPTDLVFEDRFQGLVPSDHTMVLLSGNDLLPDMAIGRIAAGTNADADALVDKIIAYEQNQLTPTSWQHRILFVADNSDFGGDFCLENQNTANILPALYSQTHLCLPGSQQDPPSEQETAELRADMAEEVNNKGVVILNYRGHGSIEYWASPNILATSSTDFWLNPDKPVVILSADCLDGHFAWPGAPALSETFLMLRDGFGNPLGTVAHWSSTGLGYTSEHTILHTGLYEGVFDVGLVAIGDAANYAKVKYYQLGQDKSEMYSFTLQGDPAMRLTLANYLFIPFAVR